MFTIEAIVSDIYQDDAIYTFRVLVLQVNNKAELTKIMNFLNKKLPMNEISLNHLKRINSKKENCQVLICPIQESSNSGSNDNLVQQTLNLMDKDLQEFLFRYGFDNLKILQVPTSAPLTRNQFTQISSLWPVNFHENKYISNCLNGTIFSKNRMKRIYELMKETLSLLDGNPTKDSKCCLNVSTIITKQEGEQIVTKAISRTNHPLHHAVILAVSNVADIHSKSKSASDIAPDLIENYKDDYLCTNYECFLSQEPCIMCAMALVHSRIRRVFFYSDPNRSECIDCNDKPYTVHNLHINLNLNHRYEVWKLSPNTGWLHQDHQKSEEIFPNKKLKS